MTLSSPQGHVWRGRKDLKNQTHAMTFQHFCFCYYTRTPPAPTPVSIVYTTTVQKLFESVSKKDRSEMIILCTTSKLGLGHFARQCWMVPLEDIPRQEWGSSQQLLITLHHQKAAFFFGQVMDMTLFLGHHVTSQPLFVIVADEWEQNTGELHHIGSVQRWEGKTNTHWLYILHNIMTSVLAMFVTGHKLYT